MLWLILSCSSSFEAPDKTVIWECFRMKRNFLYHYECVPSFREGRNMFSGRNILTHFRPMFPFYTPWNGLTWANILPMIKSEKSILRRLIFKKKFRFTFQLKWLYCYKVINTVWKVFKYWVFSGPYFPVFTLNARK